MQLGPTHVLVVRGLDENADEEMLRYEFSKHAPIKDLRLVRDKFTHVSRGFAFVHFHSVCPTFFSVIELVKYCNFIVHFSSIHFTGYNFLIQEFKH